MSDNPRPPRHPLEGPTPEEQAAQQVAAQKRRRVGFMRATPTPTITYGLIALNIILFVIGPLATALLADSTLQEALFRGGALFPSAVLGDFQVHRLLTAMFLHASLPHIALNMIALYTLGREVETLYGQQRFLAIYFLGGLAGSVLSASVGDYGIPSVGASGAIMALWSAHLLFLYTNRHLFGEERIRQVLMQDGFYLLAFIVIGFVPGAIIDNWGHIGGLLGGAVIAFLLPILLVVKQVKNAEQPLDAMVMDANPWTNAMLPTLAAVGVGLGLLLVLGIVGFRLDLFATALF